MSALRDPFKILQVPPSADLKTIRAAYRKLARQYHPDLNPSPQAQARMQDINWAYETLRDPVQRARFQALRRSTRAPRTSGYTHRSPAPPPSARRRPPPPGSASGQASSTPGGSSGRSSPPPGPGARRTASPPPGASGGRATPPPQGPAYRRTTSSPGAGAARRAPPPPRPTSAPRQNSYGCSQSYILLIAWFVLSTIFNQTRRANDYTYPRFTYDVNRLMTQSAYLREHQTTPAALPVIVVPTYSTPIFQMGSAMGTVLAAEGFTGTLRLPSPTLPPTATATAACQHWSQVGLADVGRQVCVIGLVAYNYLDGPGVIVKFSGRPDALQIHYKAPLLPGYKKGACLRVTGLVQSGESYPFILVRSINQITSCP